MHRKNRGIIHPEIPNELFRKWYDEDKHRRYGVETIQIIWTYERYISWCKENNYHIEISKFHDSLKELSRNGKAELTYYSMPDQIPEKERKCLFEISLGKVAYHWRYITED